MAGEEAGFTSRVLQGVCNLGYFVSKLLQLLSFFLSLPRMGENSSHEQNEILKISLQLIRITIKNLTRLRKRANIFFLRRIDRNESGLASPKLCQRRVFQVSKRQSRQRATRCIINRRFGFRCLPSLLYFFHRYDSSIFEGRIECDLSGKGEEGKKKRRRRRKRRDECLRNKLKMEFSSSARFW